MGTNLGPSLSIWMDFRCSIAIQSQNPSCLVQSTEMSPEMLSTLHQCKHHHALKASITSPIMDIFDVAPEINDCSCSSTMLSSSAPCCWQLFRAWCQLNIDCAFLWYWTPVTGSVSQPEVPACCQDKATKCKYLIFKKSYCSWNSS